MVILVSLFFGRGSSTQDDTAAELPAVEWPAYSGQICPELMSGVQHFQSGGLPREVQIILPADPIGKPVLFAWHYLNGSPADLIRVGGLEALSADQQVIIVAPKSRDLQFEWDFIDATDANPDLIFFDDLLSCVGQQYSADVKRVYATGMSAGGLFTTFLTHHRSEWLAATAPFSGGSNTAVYQRSTDAIPVLITWGGPNDSFGGFDFSQSSQDLSSWLREDGHFTVECEHSLGHTIPPGAFDYAWRFFQDHPKDIESEPYLSLPSAFPDWCQIPE